MTVHKQFLEIASAPMTPAERLDGLMDAVTTYIQLASGKPVDLRGLEQDRDLLCRS